MLNGGGLNPDGLSLDLQFAADKTLTARRGPTPVFTRGSTGTFVGSNGLIQSAAINTPRFDHDPVTLACKGLLIEEGRTNLMTQSEQWIGTLSGPLTPTITADTTTAPDGLLSADTLSGSTGTAFDGSLNATYRILSVSSSTTHTFSIYVKSLGVATQAEIRIRDNSTGASGQTLDTSLTSSWKRISVTLTTGAATTSVRCIIQNTNGDIAIWGAQLEAGSLPTSYIPTTTGTLARSADVCSITGGDFTGMYNQPEGTLFLNAVPPFESQLAYPLMVNTTGINQANYISRSNEFGAGSKRWRAITTTSSGIEAVISTSGDITTTNVKAAYAFKLNDNAFAVNNVLVGTDTTVTMPNPTSMRIGGNDGANVLNGHIAAIRYYKKRLPNAKLVTLTT